MRDIINGKEEIDNTGEKIMIDNKEKYFVVVIEEIMDSIIGEVF